MCAHMGLNKAIFFNSSYKQIIQDYKNFFEKHLPNKFIVNEPQLIHTAKWKFDYIICRKKFDNAFVPKFVPKKLKWYKRDGLLTWYDQTKCEEFWEDLDAHFQKLQIANFDIINSKGNLDPYKLKQYQTIKHSEILTYSQEQQDEILSSIFRTKKDGMFEKKR